MATSSCTFDYGNRSIFIDYHHNTKATIIQNRIVEVCQHNPKSPIKWRVCADFDKENLRIDPVDAAINKRFIYNLSVWLNGRKVCVISAFNGSKFECGLPAGPKTSIKIKIVYPIEAIFFCACSVKEIIHPPPLRVLEPKTHLPKMITNSRSRDKFTDVRFIVEDKEIVAHQVILADRSEVFYKMFMWNVENATNNIDPITLTDVSYDGFNYFLDAIYYGVDVTQIDPELCLEMVMLAEKYDVQDIKTAVEASIISSINMENAVNVLIHSYLNNADRVKKAALEFCAKSPMHELNGRKELAKFTDLLDELFKQISLLTKKL